MPLIQGGDLKSVFAKWQKCSEQTAKFYIAQIVLGVGHLHESGIMHRDLKLANVMLDDQGYVKVIDFGLAKIALKDAALAMTWVGTPFYVAPELL